MKFRPTKLPRDVAQTLRLCPIRTVKPYALMIAPVYVYMRANEKFVAVKSPLDFFTEAELARLAPLETFYFTPFFGSALVFREKARSIRAMMAWRPDVAGVEPAPFEMSDTVLRALAPLWGPRVQVESFFVAVFAGELCSTIDGEALVRAREKHVDVLERSILVSAWSVFVALHCGWIDQSALDRLRQWSFRVAAGEVAADPVPALGARELHALAEAIVDGKSPQVGIEAFKALDHVFARRMKSRLERIDKQLRDPQTANFTIYGAEGIRDGG